MKVLFAQEYIERVLFVLEHKGKYITVYRSSGLSGTGHTGQILPFSGLQTKTYLFNITPIGYIYKEMFYKGCWTNHRKDLSNYPEVADKMQYLQSFLSDLEQSKNSSLIKILFLSISP